MSNKLAISQAAHLKTKEFFILLNMFLSGL